MIFFQTDSWLGLLGRHYIACALSK